MIASCRIVPALVNYNVLKSTVNILGSVKVPVVMLVLEGGPGTVKTMKEAIEKEIPAVVIDGSGRAADVVAFAYKHTTPST